MADAFSLQNLMENAGAFGSGVADESSLGLSNKIPGWKEAQAAHPWSARAGHIAPYFIPVGDAAGALMHGPQWADRAYGAARMLGTLPAHIGKGVGELTGMIPGMASQEGSSFLTNLLRGAARGTIAAPIVGTGNELGREAVGSDAPLSGDQLLDNAKTQAEWGAGIGAAGEIAKEFAPEVYNHPALFNKGKTEAGLANAKDLMDRGVWGSVNRGLQNEANRLHQPINDARSEIIDPLKAQGAITSTQPLQDFLDTQAKSNDFDLNGDIKTTALKGTIGKVLGRLQNTPEYSGTGSTDLGTLDNALHTVNTKISRLAPSVKIKMFGDASQSAADNLENLRGQQSAMNDMFGNAVENYGTPEQNQTWQDARDQWRQGEDLNQSLRASRSADVSSDPNYEHRVMARIANHTIGSAPVRTALGALMNTADPGNVGSEAGAVSGIMQRNKQAEGPPKSMEQMMQEMQAPDPAMQQNQNMAPPSQAPANGKSYLKFLNDGAQPSPQQPQPQGNGKSYLQYLSQ